MRTRILDCFSFLALYCVLGERKTTAGHVITQKNASFEWINDFLFQLSSSQCQTYTVTTPDRTQEVVQLPWNTTIVMNGHILNLTLTQCNGTQSPSVNFSLRYRELVKDLKCYQTSRQDVVCSWVPSAEVRAVKFFYVFVTEGEIGSEEMFINLTFKVEECPSYIQTDGVRIGCNLLLNGTHIFIAFRAEDGQNATSVNTFRIPMVSNGNEGSRSAGAHSSEGNVVKENTTDNGDSNQSNSNVRPPALKWSVTKTKDKFHISWSYPEIPANWEIRINYTECDTVKYKDIKNNKNSTELDRVSHCPYQLTIKATSDNGYTPWTENKYFDADTQNIYAYVVFFPLMCVGLVAIVFFCFRRHKGTLFPEIPQPRDLLSSIPDSHFKCPLDNFCQNSKEELCKISLVTELHCGQLKPLKHQHL